MSLYKKQSKKFINKIALEFDREGRLKKRKMAKVSKEVLVDKLIENNMVLQHKIADLVTAMKDLSGKMDGMLKLFKEAGENIKTGKYEDPLLNKLDNLLEQNKNIAKGLLTLEKYIREKRTESLFPEKPFPKATE